LSFFLFPLGRVVASSKKGNNIKKGKSGTPTRSSGTSKMSVLALAAARKRKLNGEDDDDDNQAQESKPKRPKRKKATKKVIYFVNLSSIILVKTMNCEHLLLIVILCNLLQTTRKKPAKKIETTEQSEHSMDETNDEVCVLFCNIYYL